MYVHPYPRGPSWSITGIPFTMVFLCENVQLAFMVSPRLYSNIGDISFSDPHKILNEAEILIAFC